MKNLTDSTSETLAPIHTALHGVTALLLTWKWKQHAPPKCWYKPTTLHGVISLLLYWRRQVNSEWSAPLYQATWQNSHYPEDWVAESSEMLHLSKKLHGVTSQKNAICFNGFRVVLRHSWPILQFYNQCYANTQQEINRTKTRTPAVQAPCLFRQMSAYVLQATKAMCLFSLDNMDRHTAQRATYISCNSAVRLQAWLRLLGKFNVYTCQKIIIFRWRFTSLHPHGPALCFPF